MTLTPELLRRLPKAELHVHLDGCLRPTTMIDLAAKVRTHQPGDSIELTVVSDGQERSVTVELGSAPAN